MSKARLELRYKDLKILKHALEYYIERPGISTKDWQEEKQLLDVVIDVTSNLVE